MAGARKVVISFVTAVNSANEFLKSIHTGTVFLQFLAKAVAIPILRIGALNLVQGQLRTCYCLILGLIIANQLSDFYYCLRTL